MKTFSRAAWTEALELWKAGDFSDEWKPFRHQAAMRGMLYPPQGTKWDGWDDDEPSQRAILIRAIRETPTFLRELIDSCSSWEQIVGRLITAHNDHRTASEAEDRWQRRKRDEEDPKPRQALMSLADIVKRIADSR